MEASEVAKRIDEENLQLIEGHLEAERKRMRKELVLKVVTPRPRMVELVHKKLAESKQWPICIYKDEWKCSREDTQGELRVIVYSLNAAHPDSAMKYQLGFTPAEPCSKRYEDDHNQCGEDGYCWQHPDMFTIEVFLVK